MFDRVAQLPTIYAGHLELYHHHAEDEQQQLEGSCVYSRAIAKLMGPGLRDVKLR